MANISTLNVSASGKTVIDKLNEIIDWLNGATDANRVTNIEVTGKKLKVTYINGDTESFTLQDTTYTLASTSNDGLIKAGQVVLLEQLTKMVESLNETCSVVEKYREYVRTHGSGGGDDSGGGGDGGDYGGGGDDGDDGGHGGGGGDF